MIMIDIDLLEFLFIVEVGFGIDEIMVLNGFVFVVYVGLVIE